MPFELQLQCRCGHVRGAAAEVAPQSGFRFICYCKNCQGFARFLGRPDVLDTAGGTDIFQMPAGLVKLTAGMHAIRSLSFSGNVLRWYTDCCRTPLGNTAASAGFPVIAIIPSFMSVSVGERSRDEVLGLPLCRIHEKSATGPLPPDAPPAGSVGIFAYRTSKLLGWWMRGLGRPNPFFDGKTGAPLSTPHRLTPSERAALDNAV